MLKNYLQELNGINFQYDFFEHQKFNTQDVQNFYDSKFREISKILLPILVVFKDKIDYFNKNYMIERLIDNYENAEHYAISFVKNHYVKELDLLKTIDNHLTELAEKIFLNTLNHI